MTHAERCVQATIFGLEHLQTALFHVHQKKDRYGKNYSLFAEGLVEEILKLRAQLDETTGLADYLKCFGRPAPSDRLSQAPSDPEQAVRAILFDLEHLERVLLATHMVREKHGRNYQFFAEQTVEEILRLRGQVDELIGLANYLKTYGVPVP